MDGFPPEGFKGAYREKVMGMFDYIVCEYPLPVSELQKEMQALPDWEKVDFQTKTFDNSLQTFTISEDGLIYEHKTEREWVEDEKSPNHLQLMETDAGIERRDYTGELNFYGLYLDKKYDFFLEFEALFWKGELKEIVLQNYNKEDNSKRKSSEEELKQIFKKIGEKEAKPWYRIFSIYVAVVRFVAGLIRYFLGLAVNISRKIERWIT